MVNREICDVCMEVIWDDDGNHKLDGGLYNIYDLCPKCYEKIGRYAQQLRADIGKWD